jgi:hypothetical protein
MQQVSTEGELDLLARLIEGWLATQKDENPAVAAVVRDDTPGVRRWFVRVNGEEKDVFSLWFRLDQRSLHYETFLMPAPEENQAALYEYLLRHNAGLHGASFAIGEEDAIFLKGQLANPSIDEDELDRIFGSLYAWVERFFRPALQIGFASRLRGSS